MHRVCYNCLCLLYPLGSFFLLFSFSSSLSSLYPLLSSLSVECASVRTQIGWNQFAFAWTELTMMNPRDTCRPFGRQPNDWVTVTHLRDTERERERANCEVSALKQKIAKAKKKEREKEAKKRLKSPDQESAYEEAKQEISFISRQTHEPLSHFISLWRRVTLTQDVLSLRVISHHRSESISITPRIHT